MKHLCAQFLHNNICVSRLNPSALLHYTVKTVHFILYISKPEYETRETRKNQPQHRNGSY